MELSELMQLANQVREQLATAQGEAAKLTVTGESGAGMVRVVMNGRHEVLEVKIDKKAIDPNDITLLEDLVRAACNQATAKVAEGLRQNLGSVVGGLGIDLSTFGLGGDSR